jgi:hypothetical protein
VTSKINDNSGELWEDLTEEEKIEIIKKSQKDVRIFELPEND